MIKVGKYIFKSETEANDKIKKLGVETDEDGNEYPSHSHAVVRLGHEVLEEGYYDEKTEEYVEPILSEKFLIDVVWNGIEEHPYGWKSYAVTPSGEPIHNFYGIDYLENKM